VCETARHGDRRRFRPPANKSKVLACSRDSTLRETVECDAGTVDITLPMRRQGRDFAASTGDCLFKPFHPDPHRFTPLKNVMLRWSFARRG